MIVTITSVTEHCGSDLTASDKRAQQQRTSKTPRLPTRPAGRRLDDALSLAWNVWFIVVEDQMRLAACEVEQHLREVAVRPREPRAGVCAVVNVDRLVDETEACRVLQSYA